MVVRSRIVQVMRRFPLTLCALTFAAMLLVAAMTMDINVIELNLGALGRIEKSEMDELVTSWVLLVLAFCVDQINDGRVRRRAEGLQAEQLRVVHVTMRTVQDIVGNCLTELQLLRLHADGVVPAEALGIFDESIRVTSAKLKAIEDLEAFSEKRMALGSGLDTAPVSSIPGQPGFAIRWSGFGNPLPRPERRRLSRRASDSDHRTWQ
jgi:hypothetical protein